MVVRGLRDWSLARGNICEYVHLYCDVVWCGSDTVHVLHSRSSTIASPTDHPSCAVGVASLVGHASPIHATCILCQEETKDVSSEDKSFVLAACVQRSSLLRKSDKPSEEENSKLLKSVLVLLSMCVCVCVCVCVTEVDFLSCRLDSLWGVFTGGCGHIMHASCWKK